MGTHSGRSNEVEADIAVAPEHVGRWPWSADRRGGAIRLQTAVLNERLFSIELQLGTLTKRMENTTD